MCPLDLLHAKKHGPNRVNSNFYNISYLGKKNNIYPQLQ